MKKLPLVLIIAAAALWAQESPVQIGAPTVGSACTQGSPAYIDLGPPAMSGVMVSCQYNGSLWVWTKLGGGGGGSGTVTTSGSPVSGNMTKFSAPAIITNAVPNVDFVTPAGNAATATALAGTPSLCSAGSAPTGILSSGNATSCQAYDVFGAAFTAQTNAITTAAAYSSNASNLSSGTVAAGLLPLASSSAFGAIECGTGTTCSSGVIAAGIPTHPLSAPFSYPAVGDVSVGAMPYACTLQEWDVTSDTASTSITFDVWRLAGSSGSNTLPTVTNSIVGAGNAPALTASVQAWATPSSWTSTTFAAHDMVIVEVASVSGNPAHVTVQMPCQ